MIVSSRFVLFCNRREGVNANCAWAVCGNAGPPHGGYLCVSQPHLMQIASNAMTSAVIYGAQRGNWGNRNKGQNELG
jgi:hypothetical protein